MLSSKGKLGVASGLVSNGDDFLVSGVSVEFAKDFFCTPDQRTARFADLRQGTLGRRCARPLHPDLGPEFVVGILSLPDAEVIRASGVAVSTRPTPSTR